MGGLKVEGFSKVSRIVFGMQRPIMLTLSASFRRAGSGHGFVYAASYLGNCD